MVSSLTASPATATCSGGVYLDLTGLPPTPAEASEFLSDPRPDAYQYLIDRLLHSSRYGERWARHWLDMADIALTRKPSPSG